MKIEGPPNDDLGSELRVLLERIALALEGILDVKLHRARQMKKKSKKRKDDPK